MDTRRSFLKKTALLSGAAGMSQLLPASIQRALAINPTAGSTFMDAEHIVLLMQENRSFDHAYGTLRGVRGFNDPRAISLPNKNKVWLQTNKAGETYSPFRLDIKDTKITWMGSLPHGRQSQIDARNNGFHDNWIEAKKSDDYADMPLTMGYYTREDIPFYYALADAFTVCDQNFCSSLTGTDPNRLYFWTGSVREKQHISAKPHVQNDDVEAGVHLESFPERLEQNGISWKVYQNEIGLDHGFTQEEDVWLGNFGDNVLEYLKQYNVKFSKLYIDYLPKRIEKLKKEIADVEDKSKKLATDSKEYEYAQRLLKYRQHELEIAIDDQKNYTNEKFESLSAHEKNIHSKAFVTNTKDPNQHKLTPLNYKDENIGREINIPKGDIFHQFREDVKTGNLPTVSWLVAPECFSDHPSTPWFGSWYLSEAMDILTQNPEVWKKTIFVLAYDENDGYFDHVPPFVAPDSRNPASGKVSEGIDTSIEHVQADVDTPGSIGLGYRVPLVIASPWSRGGFVNSQVFDHTSTLQFLESFLNKKFGKNIKEENITDWRRTVCGDLTSVFRPDKGEKINVLPFLAKDPFIESIHKAKFKNVPSNFKKLTSAEIEQINNRGHESPYMPKQEKGTKPSCALPYELYAEGKLSDDKKTFDIEMKAGKEIFKERSSGSPFNIYVQGNEYGKFSSYAVSPGNSLKNSWNVNEFENGIYHAKVYGPNGFFREFKGDANQPAVDISCGYHTDSNGRNLSGNVELKIKNNDASQNSIEITDNAYKNASITKTIAAKQEQKIVLDLSKSFGWYDFTVKTNGNNNFERRYAGRVETGKESISDPLMGGII